MDRNNKIKIIINKLGPIVNQEVEFAPFMIFTGDSNLGKSYVNYLMYYFMHSIVVNMIFFTNRFANQDHFQTNITEVEEWLNGGVESFMRGFLGYETLQCDVKFKLGDIEHDPKKWSYEVECVHHNFDIAGSSDNHIDTSQYNVEEVFVNGNSEIKFKGLSDEMNDVRQYVKGGALSRCISKQLFGVSMLNYAVVLPPSRGALVGESFSVKKATSSMGMYDMFFKQYDFALYNSRGQLDLDWVKKLSGLIDGRLVTEKNEQFYVMKNGDKIPLRASASSIKEIAPFVYMLQSGYGKNGSLCFEEPESHLHPVMQVKLMDIIGMCVNNGMFFQMTTHSDYVIQRLNQLIKLNEIKLRDEKRFEELCEKHGWDKDIALDKAKINAYYFGLDENHQVKIYPIKVDDKGVKLKSFYDVVDKLTMYEDEVNSILQEEDEEDIKEW